MVIHSAVYVGPLKQCRGSKGYVQDVGYLIVMALVRVAVELSKTITINHSQQN